MNDSLGWQIEQVGTAALLIRSGRESPGGFRTLAAALPAEPNRVALVVTPDAVRALCSLDANLVWALLPRLGRGAPERALDGVRFVGSIPGAEPGFLTGLAQRLADLLDTAVVMPTGVLIAPGPGRLLVAGADRGWVTVRPTTSDTQPTWEGPRHPAPNWQRRIAGISSDAVTAVPAGLCVHPVGAPPPPGSVPFTAEPDPDRITVFVTGGALDADLLTVATTTFAPGVPAVLCDLRPDADVIRAQMLADRLGMPVPVRHGLAVRSVDGTIHTWLAGDDGKPTWPPFLAESVYRPGGAEPVPVRWFPPGALTAVGAGVYGLPDGWCVEAVPAGLWIRPSSTPPSDTAPAGTPMLRQPARQLPPDQNAISVVVDSRPPPGVLAATRDLLRAVPPGTSWRVRLLVPPGTAPETVGRLSALGVGGVMTADQLRASHPPAVEDSLATVALGSSLQTLPLDRPATEPTFSGLETLPLGTPRAVLPVADLAITRSAGVTVPVALPSEAAAALPHHEPPPPPEPGSEPVAWSLPSGLIIDLPAQVDRGGRLRIPLIEDDWYEDDRYDYGTEAAFDPAPPHPPEPTPAAARLVEPSPPRAVARAAAPTEAASAVAPSAPGAFAAAQAATRYDAAPAALDTLPARPLSTNSFAEELTTPGTPPAVEEPTATSALAAVSGVSLVNFALPATVPVTSEGRLLPTRRTAPAAPTDDPVTPPPSPPDDSTRGPDRSSAFPETITAAEAPPTRPDATDPAPAATDTATTTDLAGDAETATAAVPDEPPAEPLALPHIWTSTATDRQELRSALGWRYDAAAQEIVCLLAERPGMRASAEDADGTITDLVAVRMFLEQDPVQLVAPLREGRHGTTATLLSCLSGGLQRVPSYRGVAFGVVHGVGEQVRASDLYPTGALLWEPAPLVVAPTGPAAVDSSDLQIVVLASTARRCDDFANPARPVVVFGAATSFGVLAAEDTPTGGHRVYLTEVNARDLPGWVARARTHPIGALTDKEQLTLDRLRAAAAAQPPAGAEGAPIPLLGIGPDRRPYPIPIS